LLASGGTISVLVLNEFASVALRKLLMLISEIRVVLSTIRAVCIVQPLDIETHELALDMAERQNLSIYGGLIVAAAVRAGCTTLYTEDLQHGQMIEKLQIRNPFIGSSLIAQFTLASKVARLSIIASGPPSAF
jgi:predicted nucleic acid-binding protein